MKRPTRLILILMLAWASGTAIARAQIRDGRFWKTQTDVMKASFIEGYVEGYEDSGYVARAAFIGAFNSSVENAENLRPKKPFLNLSVSTVMKGVDTCYSDYRNQYILIGACLVWVQRGIDGVSDADREAYLEGMRSVSRPSQ